MDIKNLYKKNIKSSNKNFFYEISILIALILVATIGRYILVGFGIQPFPNFEIIMVTTFLAVIFLRPSLAIFVPLISMIASDLLLGNSIFIGSQMNKIVLFTYSGFALIAAFNIFNKDRFKKGLLGMKLKNFGIAAGLGTGFTLIYDVWTNFGWWYLVYPHNVETLATVFFAGLPFMVYHMIAGAITFTCIALPIVSFVSKEYKIPFTVKTGKIHKFAAISIIVILVALSFSGTAMEVPDKGNVWLENSDETSVKVVLDGNGWSIKDRIVVSQKQSVFSILKKVTDKNDITLNYKYYEKYDSYMINSINNDVNGEENKYWQYYVNGELASKGSDKIFVSNGDSVKWKYEIFK